VTGQSRNSIGPFGPLADHPTTQVGPSEILEATYDRPSIEGLHKYSWLPKAQDKYHDHNSLGDESKGSCVAEFVWPAKAKSSAHSHLHSSQKGKVKFTFNVSKCDKNI
jgi:hypothetical protein